MDNEIGTGIGFCPKMWTFNFDCHSNILFGEVHDRIYNSA